MNKDFRDRIKFWSKPLQKLSEFDISQIENSNGIELPEQYKYILVEYGQLSHSKTWYWYYEEDGTDHLIDCTFYIEANKPNIFQFWNELETKNPNIHHKEFIPIVATHSNNYFFLIGLKGINRGKIFDYNYDYEDYRPKLVSETIVDFFTKKIYSSFPIHHKAEYGTIKIQRHNGIEEWDLTSTYFSITKRSEKYTINFWAESDHKILNKLDDSGDTLVAYEVKLTINELPNFNNPFKIKYPDFEAISEKWGEEVEFEYYDNFYYYSHESFEVQELEIVKGRNEDFYIKISATKDDPISSVYGKAKFTITSRLKLNSKFKGYWCDE